MIKAHLLKAQQHSRAPPQALDISTPTRPYFASQPVENTTKPHPKAFGSSAGLRSLSQHDVQEPRPFGRFRRRDLVIRNADSLVISRRRRVSAVVDTPIVQLDVLVQDAQSLVDHQRRQRASQLWEHPTQLGDNSRVRVVPRV
jgi:hypothetical protein